MKYLAQSSVHKKSSIDDRYCFIAAAVVGIVLLNLWFPKYSSKFPTGSISDCSESVKLLTNKGKSSSQSSPLGVSAGVWHAQIHPQFHELTNLLSESNLHPTPASMHTGQERAPALGLRHLQVVTETSEPGWWLKRANFSSTAGLLGEQSELKGWRE